MFDDLGIILIILPVLYIVISFAVENGIKEAYKDITGKKTKDEQDFEDIRKMYEFSKKHMNNNDKEEL